jgi:hypothetical protein
VWPEPWPALSGASWNADFKCDRPLEQIKHYHTSQLSEAEIDRLMIAQAVGEITFSDASSSSSDDTDDEWSAATAALTTPRFGVDY